MCPLLNSYVEAVTPSVVVFAGGASKEVIKAKGGHQSVPELNRTDVLREERETPGMCAAREETKRGHNREMPLASQGRRLWEKPNPPAP